jgi:hypothetical protein
VGEERTKPQEESVEREVEERDDPALRKRREIAGLLLRLLATARRA